MHRTLLASCIDAIAPALPGAPEATAYYTLDMNRTHSQRFAVSLRLACSPPSLVLVMPVWTPGYYQRMDYADEVESFSAITDRGRALPWRKQGNRWLIDNPRGEALTVRYWVRSGRDFVASNWLDEYKGYVSPAGMFMHPLGRVDMPVDVEVRVPAGWDVATALQPRCARDTTYRAADFDVLYDSPILAGPLTRLPSFDVAGVRHEIVGVELDAIDADLLAEDMRKLVHAAVEIIGDVPYRRYSFIGIGASRGGIEHLESTAVGLGTQGNRDEDSRIRLDSFLIHEYFHHFNAKRIRPLELGPFDYDQGSRTTGLWVAEGLTVYYEYRLLHRAGLIDTQALLDRISGHMRAYENLSGRQHQSLAQSSHDTWDDGPFGGDPNTTISYYDKGAVVGMMLDLAIRDASENQRSLDDVMRHLYRKYYQQLARGWTACEFRAACEKIAGVQLEQLFSYVDATLEPDYVRYFGLAGLSVDTREYLQSGGWLGLSFRPGVQDSLQMDVEVGSPAWNAGVRRDDMLLAVEGVAGMERGRVIDILPVLANAHPGQTVTLVLAGEHQEQRVDVMLGAREVRRFTLAVQPDATPLQRSILAAL